jgi:hypothetical protein
MANAKSDAPKKDETVKGYSGSRHEGKPAPKRPEGASKDAVVSHVGHTEPAEVFGGDGVTPIKEFKEKHAKELKKEEK